MWAFSCFKSITDSHPPEALRTRKVSLRLRFLKHQGYLFSHCLLLGALGRSFYPGGLEQKG